MVQAEAKVPAMILRKCTGGGEGVGGEADPIVIDLHHQGILQWTRRTATSTSTRREAATAAVLAGEEPASRQAQ